MNQILIKLKVLGCDIDGAMQRFLDNEDFYLKFLPRTFAEPSIRDLKTCLDNKDIKGAFECAHSIKGVLGNMGLTPAYDIICEIVEPLRANSLDNLENKYQEFIEV